ncbi:hypothetical protein Dxin01_03061 [Deinococcus xinjiangensis]|uniref:Helix-turn-helix domain-containing protein n=1 Tax=Deinococcus xinjiangensis TaxID=457454 RepID=A0ABP9VF09_9DEIO
MTTLDTPLSIPEAAQHLGIGLGAIRAAIEKGDLKAINIGTKGRAHWRISPADLEKWRASLPTNEAAK